LDNHKSLPIPPYDGNLIEELSKGLLKHEMIQQKVSGAAKRLNIMVIDQLLKSEAEDYYVTGAHTELLDILQSRGRLSEDDAWIVSCCVHEGISEKLQDLLKTFFEHRRLGITVEHDPKTALTIHVDGQTLRFETGFCIVDNTGALVGRIKASTVIPDYQTGKAQFVYSLV